MTDMSRFSASAEEKQLDRCQLGKLKEAYKEKVYITYYTQEGEKLRRESQARARVLRKYQKAHGV